MVKKKRSADACPFHLRWLHALLDLRKLERQVVEGAGQARCAGHLVEEHFFFASSASLML
jgi:hypothetical protein